ncbi:MAG: hypothetical protein ABUL64_00645 [Singulisphaera sp.]
MKSERHVQPELMDQPNLDPEVHRQALRGLQRINLVSRSSAILWPDIASLAAEAEQPLRVLDLAAGEATMSLAWRDMLVARACRCAWMVVTSANVRSRKRAIAPVKPA